MRVKAVIKFEEKYNELWSNLRWALKVRGSVPSQVIIDYLFIVPKFYVIFFHDTFIATLLLKLHHYFLPPMKRLNKIRMLNISFNEINKLPSLIAELSNLRELGVSDCDLFKRMNNLLQSINYCLVINCCKPCPQECTEKNITVKFTVLIGKVIFTAELTCLLLLFNCINQ